MKITRLCCLIAVFAFGIVAPSAAHADYEFEILRTGVQAIDNSGAQVTQAASHPNYINELELNGDASGPAASMKEVRTELPAGLVLNPAAVTACSQSGLAGIEGLGFEALCPGASQVGVLTVFLNFGFGVFGSDVPLYNIETGREAVPRFAANVSSVIVSFESEVRTGKDYGITAVVRDTSQTLPIQGAKVTLWGVPADPIHDPQRACVNGTSVVYGCSAGVSRRPLVSYPSDCSVGQLTTGMSVNAWENPVFKSTTINQDVSGNPMTVTGCEQVSFNPSMDLRLSSATAGSPTGAEVTLTIPQSTDPDGLSTALLKRASVEFPKGIAVNAAAAEGEVGCSPEQIGLDNANEPSCPTASKLGTVEIETPLLKFPLLGSVYQAEQGNNPFGSLLALYVAARGSGTTIKFAGHLTSDPNTGALTATFDNNPQLPFETLRMRLKGGDNAPLLTPSQCGTYTTHAVMSSWSQPQVPVESDSSFTINQGCGRSGEFAPGFEAGSIDPRAGKDSSFAVRITGGEGQQNIAGLEMKLPKGLLAKLAGIPMCPDAAAAAGTCSAASRVGSVTVGTGGGVHPMFVPQPGREPTAVYLGGPYKGAPLSLAVVVPAQAGPFDLGTVTVRNALFVDPVSTQVRVVSDRLPQILQGIPISYRQIRIDIDRPGFTLNPTGCLAQSVEGTIRSALGKTAAVTDPFQVADCERLALRPKLAFKLSGAPTRRGGHPKLTATLTTGKNEANLKQVQVTLPKTEFLENAHIKTVCTRVQYAAMECPARSIYGYARAWTPLLDKPLEGPVYLRSSSHKLPDLVASLDGQIHVDLAGRIDSVKSRIRNTFETVPDAPVSKFVLTMQGGGKGLLVNNTDLCKAKPRSHVVFDGQNGKRHEADPLVTVAGCGKKRKKK